MGEAIDLRALSERAYLPGIVEQTQAVVRRMTSCPWHQDPATVVTGALSIYQDARRRWRFKCHSCGVNGDALDWIAKRDGVGLLEAARILDPSLAGADDRPRAVGPRRVDGPHHTPPTPHVELIEAWKDAEWQAEVDRIICLAVEHLWGPEGLDARAWLNARGIQDHTIRTFRLGWLEHDVFSRKPIRATADRDRPAGRKLYAPRGITIPWVAPGAAYHIDEEDDPTALRWVGCNIRRVGEATGDARIFGPPSTDAGKCVMLKGSRPGHGYPYPDLLLSQVGPPALICEGEWDALLAHQEAGHLVHVITTAGRARPQSPRPWRSWIDAPSG